MHTTPQVSFSRNSRTPTNSGMKFQFGVGGGGWGVENLKGYMYITHLYLYWLAVQAGFYSDAVECNTLSPADQVQSPVEEVCDLIFFTCYIY